MSTTRTSTLTLALLAGMAAAPLAQQRPDEIAIDVAQTPAAARVSVSAPGHAGDAVFLVVVDEAVEGPEHALAAGAILDARALDERGASSVTLPNLDLLVGDDEAVLAAIVMDARGGLDASRPIALPIGGTSSMGLGGPGGGPVVVTPVAPVNPIPPCLVVPPCGGGQAPDLIVSNIVLNQGLTSTGCTGTPLPFVGCPNGRSFTATATITNVGTCGIPCNTDISLKWGNGPASTGIVYDAFNQIVPTQGLLPGGSMTITRPFYMGPCDTPPPQTFQTWLFGAQVDPTMTIAELNEGNNFATPVQACNYQ